MIEELIVLNNIQTRVLSWGDPFNCDNKDVIVCITGNPGVPDFYIEFASTLHRNTRLPVCVVGHSGHTEVPEVTSNELKNQEHLFDLQGQLKHKFDLINKIDKKCKLHLIGHSVGAWMTMEMMQMDSDLKDRVATANLLFPTLQKMAETRNGVFLNGILRRVHTIVMLFLLLLNLLPERTKLFVIGLYSYDEMDTIKSLNVDALDKMKHLTNVVYSVDDGWAPVQYMDDLKQFHPPLHMSAVNIDHAFVLKSSEKVAKIVTELIENRKKS